MVQKAYKIRLYPTPDQQVLLARTFGCMRWFWNQMLAMHISRYANNPKAKFINTFGMNNLLKRLKEEYPWLKDVDSSAFQCVSRDLNDAYQRFFKGQNERPKFKKRKYAQSYRTKSGSIKIIDDHHIQLPILKQVYFRAGRLPQGRIINATVRINSAGQYHASVLVESENQALPKTGKQVGGDLGLKALLNLSDGYKEPIHHYEDKLASKLHYWERRAARRRREAKKAIAWDEHNKVPVPRQLSDFKNYQKARVMVAKYKQKIKNQREDQLHKLTTTMVRNYDVIVLEKLNVKAMMKNHKLARAIGNASWAKLVTMLLYKCEWYDKQLIQIAPYYTSQICAHCGKNNHRLGLNKSEWLSVREWDCPSCGTHLDRDVNAAQNILARGLA